MIVIEIGKMTCSIILCIVIIVCIIYTLGYLLNRPKKDKQLQILDAYIDSVAKANDLITVSLPINNKKTYNKLIKKLQKEFKKFHIMVRSVDDIHKMKHGSFVFSNYHPEFKRKEIYNYSYGEDGDSWDLSPSETLELIKEWPEAKLEILKIHKQNILDFNHIVNELAGYIT